MIFSEVKRIFHRLSQDKEEKEKKFKDKIVEAVTGGTVEIKVKLLEALKATLENDISKKLWKAMVIDNTELDNGKKLEKIKKILEGKVDEEKYADTLFVSVLYLLSQGKYKLIKSILTETKILGFLVSKAEQIFEYLLKHQDESESIKEIIKSLIKVDLIEVKEIVNKWLINLFQEKDISEESVIKIFNEYIPAVVDVQQKQLLLEQALESDKLGAVQTLVELIKKQLACDSESLRLVGEKIKAGYHDDGYGYPDYAMGYVPERNSCIGDDERKVLATYYSDGSTDQEVRKQVREIIKKIHNELPNLSEPQISQALRVMVASEDSDSVTIMSKDCKELELPEALVADLLNKIEKKLNNTIDHSENAIVPAAKHNEPAVKVAEELSYDQDPTPTVLREVCVSSYVITVGKVSDPALIDGGNLRFEDKGPDQIEITGDNISAVCAA